MSDQPETTTTATTAPIAPADPHAAMDRRTVLRAAGVGGAGVVGVAALAACGGSTTPPTTGAASTTSTSATTSSATSSGSGSASGSASASTSPAAAPSGTPVKTSAVPVGGGVIDAGALFVVTQPTAGQFKAFSATCTHQGCTVTKVVDGKIDCPCHQSQFDITTGAPTAESQAKRPLPAKTTTVSGDSVYIA